MRGLYRLSLPFPGVKRIWGCDVKPSDTLTFELSDEQERVLAEVREPSPIAEDAPSEGSYRAWNAHFVDPETPLEQVASEA